MAGALAGMVSLVAYYVVGGEYEDTSFRNLLRAAPVAGPFEHYIEAYEAWRARAMATIDLAYARYQIVQTVDAPPPGLPERPQETRA
ncbi:MAG: DUF4170 domain-containing protein [Dehalococcoidia bacterium]|nr:DUF4170 domain-containing protein [Dehalococcoidia bacterium]